MDITTSPSHQSGPTKNDSPSSPKDVEKGTDDLGRPIGKTSHTHYGISGPERPSCDFNKPDNLITLLQKKRRSFPHSKASRSSTVSLFYGSSLPWPSAWCWETRFHRLAPRCRRANSSASAYPSVSPDVCVFPFG